MAGQKKEAGSAFAGLLPSFKCKNKSVPELVSPGLIGRQPMTNIGLRKRVVQQCSCEHTVTGGIGDAGFGGSRSGRTGSGAGIRGKHRAGVKTPRSGSLVGSDGEKSSVGLDTSAQLWNSSNATPQNQGQATLLKRGRAKYLSRALAVGLAELKSPLEKSYRRSVYCSECIQQDDGMMTTRYCGNRWCLVCSRIRTARAVTAYGPVVESWSDPHMVTLTVRNCQGEDLRATMAAMLKAFQRCRDSIRKAGFQFRALRKLECTYNHRTGEYHPHFHVLTDGKEEAEQLRRRWLRQHPETANERAQDVRACDAGALMEVFKYFTKLTAPATTKQGRRIMPLAALDVIFRAMKGRRVWQPVGFRLPKEVAESIEGEELILSGTPAFKRQEERILWSWEPDLADWVDRETGESLAEYEPGERFRAFVGNIELAGGPAAVVSDA